MEHKKLTSVKSIKSYLNDVIQESLENVKNSKLQQKALEEKDKQDSLSDVIGSEEGTGDESAETQEQPAKKPAPEKKEPELQSSDKETLENGDVSFKDVVEKLNTIRSGKSLKDSAISAAMEKYIEGLEVPERTALLAFLKGIAQIVTGEVQGDVATEPSENPSDVSMKKTAQPEASPQKKSIKPNVIKAPGAAPATNNPQAQKQQKPGVEDSSGPTPIVPKRRGV